MLGMGAIGCAPIGAIVVYEIYYELLQTAEAMRGEKFYQATVVIAHTACEVCVARGFERLLTQHVSSAFGGAFDDLCNGYNLGNERLRKAFVSLSGLTDLTTQPFWEPFVRSCKRRNSVVHEGAYISPDEAAESFSACRDMVEFLIARLGLPINRIL